MPLVELRDMLKHAQRHGYAVGAFELLSLDFLQGVMTAAERTRAPVILSLSEVRFGRVDFQLLMSAVETAAMRATVPVAIHLAHCSGLESAAAAIKHGCNGVMVEASDRSRSNTLQTTRAVVDMAHACGVTVAARLGSTSKGAGEDAERSPREVVYTTPEEASRFVEQTGVDFLTISIGTAHDGVQAGPELDFQRLQPISEGVGIPLAVNADIGLSDAQYCRLIANGVACLYCDTALADAAAMQIDDNIDADAGSDYTDKMKGIRAAIGTETERCMRLWGTAGRADEVLSNCRPWLPVEHLIIYNVAGIGGSDAEAMIAEGRRVLSKIPGVRDVFTGNAVQDEAKYRYTWLVRFCHPAVIDSYREHPDHVDFANRLFRPVAGERISIDYQAIATVGSHVEPFSNNEPMP